MGSDDQVETPASRASLLLVEKLQASGERDQLKEILLRELSAHGWIDIMQNKAQEVARKHVASGGAPLTVYELSNQIAKYGKESIPDAVKVKFMSELLKISRAFVLSQVGNINGETAQANGKEEI